MLKTLIISIFALLGLLLFSSCSKSHKADTLNVEYISHAAFILSSDSTSILIDPFMSKHWIGYSFPENIITDATLITHPHYDHDGGRFLGEKPYWEDATKIHEEPGNFKIGNFNVTGVKGKHSDPYGKEFGQKNTIWKMEVAGISLVHLGDNGPLTEANYKALGKTDVLMIPIGSKFHILSQESINEIIARLEPKLIIPMHYRIPSLEDLDKPKGLGDIEPYLSTKPNVIRLDSNTYTLSKKKIPKTPTYLKFHIYPNLKN
jgi:L-ascorbate metabolism protein UlaG (beta-lactamase superfamily)